VRHKIPSAVQKEVRQRANFLCEYCHASELWQYVAFTKDKLTIKGLTSTGRASVNTLELNRGRVITIRKADIEIGRHPPQNDPLL